MANIATRNQEFIVHRDPYTLINNVAIDDWSLSGNAFRLLTKMLSLPEDWDFSTKGLEKIINTNSNGELVQRQGWGLRNIQRYLGELEMAGYLIKQRLKNNDGTFGKTMFHIFSSPQKELIKEKVTSSEPSDKSVVWSDAGESQKVTSSEPSDKSVALNNYINNKLNKQISWHTDAPEENQNSNLSEKPFVKPNFDDVKAYALEKQFHVDPRVFYEFYENEGWKHRSGKYAGKYVRNWKNTMLMWHKQELKDEEQQRGCCDVRGDSKLTKEEQNRLVALKKTIGMFDPVKEAEEYNELKRRIEELEGRSE